MLSHDHLLSLLDYDPATGVFRWKVYRQGVKNAGIAGTINSRKGYRQIQIDGQLYRAHRLAWFYVHGVWPTGLIDHRNHTPDDNRIDNLREATASQNHGNSKRRKHNRSGFKGVTRARQKWLARITVNGQLMRLGLFDTPEEAFAAFCEAAVKYHGEFARFE